MKEAYTIAQDVHGETYVQKLRDNELFINEFLKIIKFGGVIYGSRSEAETALTGFRVPQDAEFSWYYSNGIHRKLLKLHNSTPREPVEEIEYREVRSEDISISAHYERVLGEYRVSLIRSHIEDIEKPQQMFLRTIQELRDMGIAIRELLDLLDSGDYDVEK